MMTEQPKQKSKLVIATHSLIQIPFLLLAVWIHTWNTLLQATSPTATPYSDIIWFHAVPPAASLILAFVFYLLPRDTTRLNSQIVKAVCVLWLIITVVLWFGYLPEPEIGYTPYVPEQRGKGEWTIWLLIQ